MNQEFLIVVTEYSPDTTKILHDIFSIVLNVGLLKVNVLIENQQKSLWSLYFYHPYAHDCHGFIVSEIATVSPENCTNPLDISIKDVFPLKRFKFHGCPLNIATFPFPPFVIVRQQATNKSDQLIYDGIDITLVNHISKTLNLVPNYVQSADGKKRGMIFKNGTATGVYGMVSECQSSKQSKTIDFW